MRRSVGPWRERDHVVVRGGEELFSSPCPRLCVDAELDTRVIEKATVPAFPIARDIRNVLAGGIEYAKAAANREELLLQPPEHGMGSIGNHDRRPEKTWSLANRENR